MKSDANSVQQPFPKWNACKFLAAACSSFTSFASSASPAPITPVPCASLAVEACCPAKAANRDMNFLEFAATHSKHTLLIFPIATQNTHPPLLSCGSISTTHRSPVTTHRLPSIANRRKQKSPQLTENRGRERNSIANFFRSFAPAAGKFFASCVSLTASHSSPATAFPWPPAPSRLTGTQTETGFPLTHSKQTTVVLSNGDKMRTRQGSFSESAVAESASRATSGSEGSLFGLPALQAAPSASENGRAGIHPRRTEPLGREATFCAASPAQVFAFRIVSPRDGMTPPSQEAA